MRRNSHSNLLLFYDVFWLTSEDSNSHIPD
jgi:hypothetical protein